MPAQTAAGRQRQHATPSIVPEGRSAPGFEERLQALQEAVRTGSPEGFVPIEEIVPGWPDCGKNPAYRMTVLGAGYGLLTPSSAAKTRSGSR